MPSIFTHLLIAEDALESQPLGSGRQLLERERKAYFLGFLGPDLPYFDVFDSYRGLPLGAVLGPVTQAVESKVLAWLGWSQPAADGWAKRLHSLGALKHLQAWNAWIGDSQPALTAFFLGMATHFAADEVLHPKVQADGGDCSTAEGALRHRDIEVNLDLMLLRNRGVAIESLNLCGLLETFLGTVDRRGEHLSPGMKTAWAGASVASADPVPLTRGEIDAWSRGFSGAMRLLDHPFSPLNRQRNRFLQGGEEKWRSFLARERYLSSHVPRAARSAERLLRQGLGDPDLSLML